MGGVSILHVNAVSFSMGLLTRRPGVCSIMEAVLCGHRVGSLKIVQILLFINLAWLFI